MTQSNVIGFRRHARVLIVGATMGAGHMTAAHVLAEHLRRRGADVRVVDYLALPRGPQGRLARGIYRWMIRRAPMLYDAFMRGWMRHPALFGRVAAIGTSAHENGLAREMRTFTPDVVISTYNLAGQMLGRLRRRGELSVPAVAYVTDAGAHPYWVASGVDLHLAPLPATASELKRMGAERVEVVDPLVPCPSPMSKMAARRSLALASDDLIAVVNGGSWGVGSIIHAARSVAATGASVYVLCGHSRKLAAAVSKLAGCRAVGWTNDVAIWIKAADVLVGSAGGTTCWEAIVAATPVILHRPLAGHGRLNAATLAAAGLVTVTSTEQEITTAIELLRRPKPAEVVHGVDAADAVLAAA